MPSYPIWCNEDADVFLREVGPGLFVGAKGAASVRPWALVVDLHGIELVTADELILHPFSDRNAFPPEVLDQVYSKVERVRDRGGATLMACDTGRSRSASAAYAMLRTVWGVGRNDAQNRISTQTTVPVGRQRRVSVTHPRRETFLSASEWVEQRLDRLRA